MEISVIIPAYNAEKDLPSLLDSLAFQQQSAFEVIVVDDGSCDRTPEIAKKYSCRFFGMGKNRGPACCRNLGAKVASGDILAFTDSDCIADAHWIHNISVQLGKKDADAIMGRVVLPPSNIIGDAISALGFPAGGSIGFERMWRVDRDGYTDSLSTCNCAIRAEAFWKAGAFDESFPYPGGEDSLLAWNLKKSGSRIRFCKDVIVSHQARDSLKGFFKWQFRRGVSSYIFSTNIPEKGRYISLRLWSTRNIIRAYWKDRKFPLILYLWFTGTLIQTAGFSWARRIMPTRNWKNSKISPQSAERT